VNRLILLLLAACGSEETARDIFSRPAEAENAVGPSDPRFEGQQRFLYDTFGTERLPSWPTADFLLALMRDEPEVFGDQFARFGFVPDPNDEFPVGLKRGTEDPSRVHETCAMCHVGQLPDGRLWFGLPRSELDIGRFRVEVDRRWVAAGNPSLMSEHQSEKLLGLGPGRTSAESYEYPMLVPADFPVYFDLGARRNLNYLGTGRNARTEVHFAIFAFGAGDPDAEGGLVPLPPSEHIDALVEFLSDIEAPPPPAGDAGLAERGRTIFEREQCSTCHHVDDLSLDEVVTRDEAPDGRERLPGEDEAFPRGSIRTDRLHRAIGEGDAIDTERVVAFLTFAIENRLMTGETDGYRPSDLHGLWASAPYLHNGSVPTLEALLETAANRPARFERHGFTVDTTLPGSSNEGHEFGASLSNEDKAALVEYLRSL
jgi:hypothetical protein